MKEKIAILKQALAGGVTSAMATPLHEDTYEVKTAVIPHLTDFLIERGVRGLFAGGSTGEGIVLPLAERKKLHEGVVTAVSGRVPVLVHVGSIRTDWAVELTEHAAAIQADAIAAITPNFYKLDDEDSLVRYYKAIAAAAPTMPLILYDIPQLATNGISPNLLKILANEIPSLVGIKSSRPDAQIIRQLLDAAPPHLLALAGNEAIALGLLALGMDGLLSGLSTAVPEPIVALVKAITNHDLVEAQRQQTIIRAILALTPSGKRIGWIKQILIERGISVGPAVPPRLMPDGPSWPQIQAILEQA
ncbi:MAG: dihydrodipicolinate synthase family protein [Anaerolineae bacterium]|nr:dihydrodipicolinate synthase family protein [Anaerolineae bacterium]